MSDHDTPSDVPHNVPLAAAFKFEDQPVRTVIKDGEVWFVVTDVCSVLEHGNPTKAILRLDQDEKDIVTVGTGGGAQEANVVNESGLYYLIVTSRKPQAKKFRRWVTREVLPSIRRTGSYDASRPNSSFAKIARNEAVTAVLPGWGRYTVIVGPDGTHRSARMEYRSLIEDDDVVTLELLCHQVKLIGSFWTKITALNLVALDPAVSFSMDHFSKAISTGDEIATHVLRTCITPRTEH
jgi:prophage antirepressor-like protein